MTTPVIDKVTALLAKAERTDNDHEREAYMEAAQRLATKHQIDEAMLRANGAKNQQKSELISKTIKMGAKRTPGLFTFVELFDSVARSNDVRIAVSQDSVWVFAFGYDTDIAMVEVLYTSLLLQMSSECNAYIAKGEFKSEMVWRDGYMENYGGSRGREWVEGAYKPMSARAARLSFQKAFASRVGERLQLARWNSVKEAEKASTGTELVLVNKSAVVRDFYDQTSGAKGSWKGGQGNTESWAAKQAGRAAGDRASLGGKNVSNGSKGQIG